MEFLYDHHLAGLFIGICTFLIIGLFHPLVVKAEYYWGTKCWWIFLIWGIIGVIASLSVSNVIISSLLGVFAFSSFWTIKEVFDQEKRVKKGWFPKNPKRNTSSERAASSGARPREGIAFAAMEAVGLRNLPFPGHIPSKAHIGTANKANTLQQNLLQTIIST